MEPITTAIIAGLAAGATAGATQVGKKALVDAYNALKTILQEKFGKESKLTNVVAELEAKPYSKEWQLTMEEEVEKAGVEKDKDVVQAAKLLAVAVKNYAADQRVNIGFDLKNIEIAIIDLEAFVKKGIGVKMRNTKGKKLKAKVTVGEPSPNM